MQVLPSNLDNDDCAHETPTDEVLLDDTLLARRAGCFSKVDLVVCSTEGDNLEQLVQAVRLRVKPASSGDEEVQCEP